MSLKMTFFFAIFCIFEGGWAVGRPCWEHLELVGAMLDNLGSLWWAKLGGSLVRSILSSNEPLIFGSVLLGLLNFLLGFKT